jgi:hypothetical protein
MERVGLKKRREMKKAASKGHWVYKYGYYVKGRINNNPYEYSQEHKVPVVVEVGSRDKPRLVPDTVS